MGAWLVAAVVAYVGLTVAPGCGSDSDVPGPNGDGGSGPGPQNGFGSDSGGATSSSGGVSGCGDIKTDPKNCGACGKACAAVQACVGGTCVCPPYQSFCGGACIPTVDDPSNCGACGKKCDAGQVCSGGTCSSSCLPGLEPCAGRCVDLKNDSNNCNACGNPCGPGKGCSNGACIPVVSTTGSGPANCAGGGPPIVSAGVPNGGCLGELAQTTFLWSLCSCTDLDVSAPLTTDAFDSRKGPYQAGEIGGGVGVDRDVTHWSQAVTIGGTFWSSGTGNYASSGPASAVKGEFHLAGSWNASSSLTVAKDSFVGGTLSGVTVAGKQNKVTSVPAPCACGAADLVPVGAIVAAHVSPNNDNASLGLADNVLDGIAGPARLDLPCGNYYFTKIAPGGPLTVAVHGRTAIYVAGDVTSSNPLAFVLDPTAELDIFIGGTIVTSQTLVIGSPAYPALSRTYVGGAAKLKFSQDVRLAGEFYAGSSALVDWTANNEVYGAVFAGNFKASQVTNIHYDRAVLLAGQSCPPPAGSGGTSSGGTGTTCNSCTECSNQACVNGQCGGACTDSSQCCAPLVCSYGECISLVK
jgi:hypothetical protein